jgi:hypothetical protein
MNRFQRSRDMQHTALNQERWNQVEELYHLNYARN